MPFAEKRKHIDPDPPLVTVVTPLYNAGDYIAATINSVKAQQYEHWEMLIIDDASTDHSLEEAKRAAEIDPRILIVSLPENKGAAYCRNLATDMASGTFISFLDADDVWLPSKLSRQLRFMKENDCDVSFTSYYHINENGDPLNKRVIALPKLDYNKQLRNNYIGNLTGMYRVTSLGKIYTPDLPKRQDWALWLEAIKKSGKAALGLREDLSGYRVRKGSMSAGKFSLIRHNYAFFRTYLGDTHFQATMHMVRFFWEYLFIRPRQIENIL